MKTDRAKIQGYKNYIENQNMHIERLKHHNDTLQGIIDKGNGGVTRAEIIEIKTQNVKLKSECRKKDEIISVKDGEYEGLSIEFAAYKRSKIMLWVFGTFAGVYAGGIFLRVIS